MSFVPVVKLTDEIVSKIEATAKTFCEKHGVTVYDGDNAYSSIQYTLDKFDSRYAIWIKRFRRACGSNCVTHTGWGFAGYNTKN